MKQNAKNIITYTIFILAILSFAYGVYSGEMKVVLDKAVTVCFECCGIG